MSFTENTFAGLAAALAQGETTSRALMEASLEAIAADPRAFTDVDAEGARAAADAVDQRRATGTPPSIYAGIPVSVKALFDLAGRSTAAGSVILANAPSARVDAPIVARLRAAGLIVMGRTQMSEFAFTGLGLNPHCPQPPNPIDVTRAPGGSSGGAAVSVALGQVAGAIGTDTGGSVRIPAAFCGLVGFKPTQARIGREGAFALSATLDSIGPIANTVACCAALDSLMADAPLDPAPSLAISALRLGTPKSFLIEDMAPEVAAAWDRTLAALAEAGARIETFAFPELDRVAEINARGTISNAEAYALHRRLGLLARRNDYDPNVLARVEAGARMSAADYLDLLDARRALIAETAPRTAPFDAVICPTVPILAPRIADVAAPDAFARANALTLRNPSVVNLLDRCAISLPMACDVAPAGLMLIGEHMGDARLLAVAEAVERALG